MRKLSILLLILMSQTSCLIVLLGVTNDYDKLTESQKAKIKKAESFDGNDRQYIYEISGKQLHQELKRHPKAIVYTFANGCSSENCKPLNVYEEYADKNGYKLFCVMTTGYYQMDITMSQNIQYPVYAMDYTFYNETKTRKVQRFFQNEMLGKARNSKPEKHLGNLWFFNNGVLENNHSSLPQ